jgi:hypothetical protein
MPRAAGRRSPPTDKAVRPRLTRRRFAKTEEKFSSAGSALSFNFGTGHGWSYISGGIGQSTWSVIPVGRRGLAVGCRAAEDDQLRRRCAMVCESARRLQLRRAVLRINPGPAFLDFPGSPRTTLLVIGAGVSVK